MEITVKKRITKKQLIKKAYNLIGLKGTLKIMRIKIDDELSRHDLKFQIVRKGYTVEIEGVRTYYEADDSWDDAYNWSAEMEFINKKGEWDWESLDITNLSDIKSAVLKVLKKKGTKKKK